MQLAEEQAQQLERMMQHCRELQEEFADLKHVSDAVYVGQVLNIG